MKEDGRLKLYKAVALIETGKYEEATKIVNPDFILCDIKEGEVSISRIWTRLYKELIRKEEGIRDEKELEALCGFRYPLPVHLDFRMDR